MSGLTIADIAALIWFFLLTAGYSHATRYGRLSKSGIVSAADRRVEEWMSNMAMRDNRMLDVNILANLSRGNAFFASTSIFVTGAMAALLGNVEELQLLAAKFPFLHQTTVFMWQFKVLFMMGIFLFAFFKFAWAFRLSHYTGILIGSTPIASGRNKRICAEHAQRAAKLASGTGRHANSGLRAYYFGIAALGWFIHPIVFMVIMAWVIGVIYRREYRSRALDIISGEEAEK